MNVISIIRNLSIEMKSSVIFAVVALFFSLFVGVMRGVGFGTVMIRTLLLTAMFGGLGFAVIAVIKKFVPELYGLINENSVRQAEQDGPSGADEADRDEESPRESAMEQPDAAQDIPARMDAEVPIEPIEKDSEEAVAELSNEDFRKLNLDDLGKLQKQKLGKHIIAKEKIFSYEPKIMAEAVKTMMKRDGD